jgi:hypothetical protein
MKPPVAASTPNMKGNETGADIHGRLAAGEFSPGRKISITTGKGIPETPFKTPLTLTEVLAGTVKFTVALLLAGRFVPGPKPKVEACVSARTCAGLSAARMVTTTAATITSRVRHRRADVLSKSCVSVCLKGLNIESLLW